MSRLASRLGAAVVAALSLAPSALAQPAPGLVDAVLDASPTSAKVVADGVLGIDEYGPDNAYRFVGGGKGFGGTLGNGAIYMKQDLEFLYIGVQLGAPLNDDVCLWLDTREGGFTDADMDDAGDGGRRISTNLTRDVDDPFEATFGPDFTVVVGSFGIVVFELAAGGPITFLQFSGDLVGVDPDVVREIAIPKATIAMGTSLRFFAGYFSESNFTSDETIPPQPFTGLGNPGFGGGGVPGVPDPVWTSWNAFDVAPHPGSLWKIRQLDLEHETYGDLHVDARDYYRTTPSAPFGGPYRRWEWLWTPRSNQVESPQERFGYALTAWAQWLNCPLPYCPGPSVPHSNWRPLGPFSRPLEPTSGATANGVGIVVSMWVDPANANHILMGSELGGLWETTNLGGTWRNLTQQINLPNLGCRDIAVDPNNSQVIYACMGFGDFGLGVIKSTNGGLTWSCTTLLYSVSVPTAINRVVHHPTVSGTLFAIVGNKIHKTTDGGVTWPVWLDLATTCAPAGQVGVLGAIEKDPGPNNIWYVASYANWSPSIPARVFQVSDNGATGSCFEITPKTSSSQYYATGGFIIGVAPSQPGRVSAYFVVGSGWGTPMMASTVNAGLSWSTTGSSFALIAGARVGALVVSPTNPDVMYLAGVQVYRSVNNGLSFVQVSDNFNHSSPNYVHDDIRVQVFRSGTSGPGFAQDVVYVGSDGGPWVTTNGGTTWTDISGQGLNITKFYGMAVASDRSIASGGCQDLSILQYDYFTQSWWNPGRVGDAYETTIDPTNGLIVHSDAFGGGFPSMYKSTDGMDTLFGVSAPACSSFGPCSGSACASSPNRPMLWDASGKLYLGNHDLFVSTNSGATWTQISDFATSHGIACGHRIRSIAIPANDPTRIYVGFDGPTWGGPPTKRVFRSSNSGATWTDVTFDPFFNLSLWGVQWANLTHVEVDPDNGDRVWAAFGDYWPGNRIWYSNNAGATWNNVSAGLTDAPVHDVVYERCTPDHLYAATEQGVFFWNSAINQWVCWKDNLPNPEIIDLEINYASGTIIAGTHGRGLWEADLVPSSKTCGCATPPDAMTLWLPFDEGTGAIANNGVPGNDAAHSNGPIAIPGKVGMARFYDPSMSQWSDLTSYAGINIGSGDFTVEGWIRRAGTNPNDGLRVIVDKRGYVGSLIAGYHVWLIDGQLGLQLADNTPFNFYSGEYIPLDGQWHQFAVTVDRDNPLGVKFYIDGAPAGSTGNATLRPGSLTNNAKFTVGSWTGGSGAYFHGGIDELEVFTRVLTPTEVSALYTAQSTGKCRYFCDLPPLSVFCPGDTTITVNATICNAGIAPRTFNVWFQGLAGGMDGCAVPGPVNYTPFGKFPVTVAAGACQNVPVQIGLPTNTSGPTCCYIMFIEDPITGDIRSCRGTLQLPVVLCGGFGGGWWTALMAQPIDLPIEITSFSPAEISAPYRIHVLGHDGGEGGEDAGELVRLNGLPPGEPVLGTLSIAGGATIALKPVSVEFVGGAPGGGYSIVLSADLDGDGVLEPIAASQLILEQPPECPAFADDFESSSIGPACTDGSWQPWQNEVDVCANVTNERAFAGTKSLKLVGVPGGKTGLGDDTVLDLPVVTTGTHTFRCMTYIPTDATGDVAVILLNTYDDGLAPDASWYSAQVRLRAGPNLVQADFGAGSAALVKGQWVELRIEIDLDNDLSNYYYGGVHFIVDRPWTQGVLPGAPGLLRIQAIDLYAGEPGAGGTSGAFFDNISLAADCPTDPGQPCRTDWDFNGVVNSTDVSAFINDWFEDQVGGGGGTVLTDFNHDGVSNSTDVSDFINAWFEETAFGC